MARMSRTDSLAIAQGQALAEAWNEHTPEGTAVELIDDLGTRHRTRTRSVAWTFGSGEPVVMVEGRAGGYLLSRLVRCAEAIDASASPNPASRATVGPVTVCGMANDHQCSLVAGHIAETFVAAQGFDVYAVNRYLSPQGYRVLSWSSGPSTLPRVIEEGHIVVEVDRSRAAEVG